MCDTKEFCRGRFQRYKGIELFFKRLAFNLGNSPSQTEVKIISCVPIDVTEMQQRINALEKELEEVHRRGEGMNVHTALHTPTFNPELVTHYSFNKDDTAETPTSVHYPNFAAFQDSTAAACDIAQSNRGKEQDPATNTSYPNENVTDSPSDLDTTAAIRNSSATSLEYSAGVEPPPPKRSPIRNIFRKAKKQRRYKNDALVYHAKTFNNPMMLQTKKKPRKSNIPKKEEFFDRLYVRGLMRLDQDAQSIQSTPVCRDVSEPATVIPRRYESDACSSCHVRFQDIDNYAPKLQYNRHFYTTKDNNSHSYYDDELYDMVPVKDESSKPKKVNMEPPSKYSRDEGQIKIGSPRAKRKPHMVSDEYRVLHRKQLQYKRDKLINKMSAKPSFCVVEYGDVYTKSITSDANVRKSGRNKTPVRRDPVVLRINEGTNTVCEMATETELMAPEQPAEPKEPKTEETLDQIKTILRSVLSEVKSTTVKQRNQNVKADAVVQKDASHVDMNKRSRLLQSYTYSPYDINPCIAPCNRQIATSPTHPNAHVAYPSTYPYQGRCQTFPLIVQQSPMLSKPFCASCSRQNPPLTKPFPVPTIPNTTSANVNKSPSKKLNTETEQLIKEIYNSLNHEIIAPKEPEKVPSLKISGKSVKTESLRRNTTLTTIKSASPFESMTTTSSSALDTRGASPNSGTRATRFNLGGTRDASSNVATTRDTSPTRERLHNYRTELESRNLVERRRNIGIKSERVLSRSEVMIPRHSRNEGHAAGLYRDHHHHHHHDDAEYKQSEELLCEELDSEEEAESIYLYNTEESDDPDTQAAKKEKSKGLFSKIGSVFRKRSADERKRSKGNETHSESDAVTDADDDEYPTEPRRPHGFIARKPARPEATLSTNRQLQIERELRHYKEQLHLKNDQALSSYIERQPRHNFYHKNYHVQSALLGRDDSTTDPNVYVKQPHDNRKPNISREISTATDNNASVKSAFSWLKKQK